MFLGESCKPGIILVFTNTGTIPVLVNYAVHAKTTFTPQTKSIL